MEMWGHRKIQSHASAVDVGRDPDAQTKVIPFRRLDASCMKILGFADVQVLLRAAALLTESRSKRVDTHAASGYQSTDVQSNPAQCFALVAANSLPKVV